MDLKSTIYSLLKLMRAHCWSISEEETLRQCVAFLADALYERDIRSKLTGQMRRDGEKIRPMD